MPVQSARLRAATSPHVCKKTKDQAPTSIARMKWMTCALMAAALAATAPLAHGAASGLSVLVGCAASSGNSSSAGCAYAPQQTTDSSPNARLFAQDEVLDPATGALNSAVATAYARYGALGVLAQASASTANPLSAGYTTAGSNAAATAVFGDTMLLTAPGLAGTAGVMTVRLKLDGDLHAWDYSPATGAPREGFQAILTSQTSFFDATVGGQLLSHRFTAQAMVTAPGEQHSADVPTTLTLEVPIVFGHSVYFQTELSVRTEANVDAPGLSPDDPTYGFPRVGGATASFLHTLRWDGISRVTDAQGRAVDGFGVASATGIDWRVAAPVPEPSTAALLGLGVALLAWRQRRA